MQVTGRGGLPYRYFVCANRHATRRCRLPYLAEHAVEEAVERYYRQSTVFDSERLAALETQLAPAIAAVTKYRADEVSSERDLVARLEAERRRLLDGLLEGLVPKDLFAAKQDELRARLIGARARLEAAERDEAATNQALEIAVKLLRHGGAAYAHADDITQRAWNQTFFTRLFVAPNPLGEPEVTDATLNEPFAQILDEGLARELKGRADKTPAAFAAGGSNVVHLVETVGIEPTSAVASK